jgi:hypothetical protein
VRVIRMNLRRIGPCLLGRLIILGLAAGMMRPELSLATTEETFDVLQIGTHTYKKVTVTTKAKNQIFILHSAGMSTIKVADLPPELLEQLGYGAAAAETSKAKGSHTSLSAMTKQTFTKLKAPQIKDLQKQWRTSAPAGLATVDLTPNLLMAAGVALLLLYLLMCYCGMLICLKCGHPPGALVWIPVLQLIPLLRAAQMSPAWILAYFVPVLNVIAQIIWSFSISKARGKSAWVGFFLLLPITSLIAYLYLALSDAAAPKEERVVEMMTLETA